MSAPLCFVFLQRLVWLRLAHDKLDRAVLDAYGWPPDISGDDLLARLLEENLKREPAGGGLKTEAADEEAEEKPKKGQGKATRPKGRA